MAYGGMSQNEEGGWAKFVVFEGEAKDLDKFLSSHQPSDPSWNTYVIFPYTIVLCDWGIDKR